MQHACAILSMASLASPYFTTLSHKRHDFRKKFIRLKMCVLRFSTTFSKTYLILQRIQLDIVINVKTSSCEVPFILVGLEWNLNFLDIFSKKTLSNFIKLSGSRAVPCELTDGHDEANSRFSKFCEKRLKVHNLRTGKSFIYFGY
jgi:hypothetical protein